ncbi:Os05g0187800, partial [Oryza sativa Japonica Group]
SDLKNSIHWTHILHINLSCLDQALSAIPFLDIYFLGVPMVSMLLYVWSREYPNSQISMYGLVQLRVSFTTTIYRTRCPL